MNSLSEIADKHAEDLVVSFRQLWLQEFGLDSDYNNGEALMEYLDTFETSLRSAFRRKLATHLRKRNSYRSKLPTELLQKIFYFTLFGYSGGRDPKYLSEVASLRSVSTTWRDIVNGTPLLWTKIRSSDRPAFISEAFERSKERPLHLEYRGSDKDESGSAFLDKAIAHLHRWQSISIDSATYGVMIQYFIASPPMLKSMSLSSNWQPEDPVRVFGGLWTSLEELRIKLWQNLDWGSIQSGRLRTLEIEFCDDLELSVVLRIIQENQHLEVLKLKDVMFLSLPSLSPNIRPSLLSNLKSLRLTGLRISSPNVSHHHATYYMLRHIQFPSCTRFVLATSFSSDSEINFEEFMSSLPSPEDILKHPSLDFPTSPSASCPVKACFSSTEFVITTGSVTRDGMGFEVSLGFVPRDLIRHWMYSLLRDKPLVSLRGLMLSVFIGGRHMQLDDIAYFQEWEAITHLSIKIHAWHRQEEVELRLLQMLATPHTSASGARRMAFPGLRLLQVHLWDAPREAVVEMIRKRFGTPEVEMCAPEIIIVESEEDQEEFTWAGLDGIRSANSLSSIWFGPMSSQSSRPLDPEEFKYELLSSR
ncbi:hypothetical protein FS837_011418 [Tulasnella sp. UAMH 9824]|nr:hypothetical protein FS837_011418 [Tulasnella sp. UAMH 9824]